MGYIAQGTFGGAWTAYTPTLTGFSVQPGSIVAESTKLGPKTFAYKWDMASVGGTSNSTSFTITMPFLAKVQNRYIVMGLNNSAYTAFEAYTAAGSNVISFFSLAGGALTASGTKGSWGCIVVEEQ